jgi:phosphatidylethanolamine-binding protein (PEBP) family uncharacterized protein
MRSASTRPWILAAGILTSLAGCSADDEPVRATAGGAGGAGGSAGAGAPATGGGAGTAAGAGGSAGAGAPATGGGAGTAAGSGATAAGGAGAGGSSAGAGGAPAGGAAAGASGASGAGGEAGAGGASGASSGMGGMSGASGASGTSGGGSAGSSSGALTLTSPNHMEGAEFGDKYTCAMAGFNGSLLPQLDWTAGPTGTMSYAITFIDVTLTKGQPPSDLGYHWVIWNIPASTRSLPEAFMDQASIGAQENRDFLGPCPNAGGGSANTDTYEFTIYALSQESITVSGSGTGAVKDAETKLEAMNLAKAKLTGTSNASPP